LMPGRRVFWQRSLRVIAGAAAALALLFFLLNPGGWRARILARLLRVDNYPVVVTPSPNFQPQVPPGFKVSVFAKGFTEPRWLAVSPSGDVFVADSAAGSVVVVHDPEGKGSAESREIFADHLALPFGIAFHDEYVYVVNTNEVLRFRYDPRTSKRSVQMGRSCLFRWDRGRMSRSKKISVAPPFWCLTPMGKTCGSMAADCGMPLELASIQSPEPYGLR